MDIHIDSQWNRHIQAKRVCHSQRHHFISHSCVWSSILTKKTSSRLMYSLLYVQQTPTCKEKILCIFHSIFPYIICYTKNFKFTLLVVCSLNTRWWRLNFGSFHELIHWWTLPVCDSPHMGQSRALCRIQLLSVTRFGGHMDVNC